MRRGVASLVVVSPTPSAGLGARADIRDLNDEWVRVHAGPGDFLEFPTGIEHRFSVDSDLYVQAMRLFPGSDDPDWSAVPRSDIHGNNTSRTAYVDKYLCGIDPDLDGDGHHDDHHREEAEACVWRGMYPIFCTEEAAAEHSEDGSFHSDGYGYGFMPNKPINMTMHHGGYEGDAPACECEGGHNSTGADKDDGDDDHDHDHNHNHESSEAEGHDSTGAHKGDSHNDHGEEAEACVWRGMYPIFCTEEAAAEHREDGSIHSDGYGFMPNKPINMTMHHGGYEGDAPACECEEGHDSTGADKGDGDDDHDHDHGDNHETSEAEGHDGTGAHKGDDHEDEAAEPTSGSQGSKRGHLLFIVLMLATAADIVDFS